jgi:hypothetical protein
MDIDGIKVFGYLGWMAIVRQNHIINATTGIRFVPLEFLHKPQWIVADNMAQGAAITVETTAKGHVIGILQNLPIAPSP